jgi:hypothetical protein
MRRQEAAVPAFRAVPFPSAGRLHPAAARGCSSRSAAPRRRAARPQSSSSCINLSAQRQQASIAATAQRRGPARQPGACSSPGPAVAAQQAGGAVARAPQGQRSCSTHHCHHNRRAGHTPGVWQRMQSRRHPRPSRSAARTRGRVAAVSRDAAAAAPMQRGAVATHTLAAPLFAGLCDALLPAAQLAARVPRPAQAPRGRRLGAGAGGGRALALQLRRRTHPSGHAAGGQWHAAMWSSPCTPARPSSGAEGSGAAPRHRRRRRGGQEAAPPPARPGGAPRSPQARQAPPGCSPRLQVAI